MLTRLRFYLLFYFFIFLYCKMIKYNLTKFEYYSLYLFVIIVLALVITPTVLYFIDKKKYDNQITIFYIIDVILFFLVITVDFIIKILYR